MNTQPEPVGEGVERLSLRTPTLPPATETNTYLVGRDGAFYVVEPATPYAAERRALFDRVRQRAARETLLGAVLTHHHVDHVGAAQAFRDEFGAPVFAHPRTAARLAERGITVDRALTEGDTLLDGAVRVLLTPGHAPGHLCLFHERGAWLIAGDMVASVGTILIDPDDDGDMDRYVRELARLAELPLARMLPAHGDPITDPIERLRFYIAHREQREAKVLAAVPHGAGGADLPAVVRTAYNDTPAWLWPLAGKSARAHLARLVARGAVRTEGERWLRA